MPSSEFEAVVEKLRALFAAEYHRGEQDAIARIVQAAQVAPHATAALSNGKAETEPNKGRAPPGTAKALIERVLRERGQRGASPLEIKNSAASDIEKLATLPGIRFVLSEGRKEKKFWNRKGRWHLRQPRPSELPGSDSR